MVLKIFNLREEKEQYAFNNNVANFDSFGVEHIPKEIKNIICNKNIRTNIFRMQAYNSVLFWIY